MDYNITFSDLATVVVVSELATLAGAELATLAAVETNWRHNFLPLVFLPHLPYSSTPPPL
jgi:hypothetical protein